MRYQALEYILARLTCMATPQPAIAQPLTPPSTIHHRKGPKNPADRKAKRYKDPNSAILTTLKIAPECVARVFRPDPFVALSGQSSREGWCNRADLQRSQPPPSARNEHSASSVKLQAHRLLDKVLGPERPCGTLRLFNNADLKKRSMRPRGQLMKDSGFQCGSARYNVCLGCRMQEQNGGCWRALDGLL